MYEIIVGFGNMSNYRSNISNYHRLPKHIKLLLKVYPIVRWPKCIILLLNFMKLP